MTDCSTPKRAILAPLQANSLSPVSPMANLKLLTKVAAGFDEDLVNNNNRDTNNGTSYQMEIVSNEFVDGIIDDDDECCSLSNFGGGNFTIVDGGMMVTSTRRFRSLKHIFREFLILFPLQIPGGGHKIMSIVQLSKQLRVQKRRVYDVINVVICLHLAFKVCKDRYQWYGNKHLDQALSLLKMYALYRNLDSKLVSLMNRETQDEEKTDEPIPFEEKTFFEDNRIGALCQKFMMLMLVTREGEALSLTLASKLILTSDIQFKTGMRRLYDIANALEALGLIEKSPRRDVGKPFFIYSGPKIEMNGVVDPSELVNPRFNYDTDTSESSLDSAVPQISSSTDIHDRFVKITPKIQPTIQVREMTQLGEPSAKKRLAFPRPSRDDDDAENPTAPNDGPRKSITYIRSPFALKGYVSTKPASLVEKERNKVYSEKIRIQPSPQIEPAVTVVENVTNAIISPGLQDGGIYKAYKVGNTFQLVKL